MFCRKLHRTLKFKGPLLNWISSFISNRHQRGVFRGKMSDFVPVLSGVPQGSVLGPLLFNIYVNDLHLHLRSKIFQYADDTFLFRVINDDSDVQFLQNDLATLHWWSENNALQLNPQKCQVMCISRRKNKPSPEYFVSNTKLSTATSLHLLGVQISSDLTWNEQVSSVTKKCNKLLGFLRTVVGNQNQNILFTLYRSLVLPIIDSCSPVWFVYRKNHINNLETIQRRATRFILGQKRGDHSYGERLKQLNLMDLNNRRKYLSTCFACSCISNTTSSFVFSNWSVNSCHPDALLFNDHITPKTDSFKFTIAANFPRMWAELPDSVRDNFILYSMSSFKKHLQSHFTEISYVQLELDS